MEKQFVTYEIALKLKELGFDEECFGVYYDYKGNYKLCFDSLFSNKDIIIHTDEHSYYALCLAPLWQQVIDFFREKHNIHIEFQSPQREFGFYSWTIHQPIKLDSDEFNCTIYEDGFTNDYYKSREQAILKAIELIKKQNGTN